MRILIVTHYWRPHLGGVENVAWQQAKRLVQRGHLVSVVTSRLTGDPPMSKLDGFPIYRVRAANVLELIGIPYPIFTCRLFWLLARLVPKHDVVFVHSHTFLSSVAAALVARRHKRPVVLLQHNPFVNYRFPWNIVEHAADLILGRFTMQSAQTVLAISEYTSRYVKQLTHGRSARVLYNGVDSERFAPVSSPQLRKQIRNRLGLPSEPFLLLTVGRLVFRNGLDTLLIAWEKFKSRGDMLLIVGGGGPEYQTLERLIRQKGLTNVRLAGFIPDDLLPDFYKAADAFVLPTRTGEGSSLVLLEALASGIPVISTQGGGQEELVENGRNALLVPPGMPERLAEAVSTLKGRPELLKEMGRQARIRALEMDWDRSVDELEQVLMQTTERMRAQAFHMDQDGR